MVDRLKEDGVARAYEQLRLSYWVTVGRNVLGAHGFMALGHGKQRWLLVLV